MTREFPSNYISEAQLVPQIVAALRELGGRARKSDVEKKIHRRFEETFTQPYYQEEVSGVVRWKHYIAWAKEQAKHAGLVKRPLQSGRGIWELTERAVGKLSC